MNKFEINEHAEYNFLSVHPMPSESELKDFYERVYYQNNSGPYQDLYSDLELEYFTLDCKVLQRIYDQTFSHHSRRCFIDIGCGEGYQSKYFLKNGWDVICYDYSDYGILNHNSTLMPYFFNGEFDSFLEHVKSTGQKPSIILLKNVLEHVVSPISTLNSIKEIMDEKTLLSISVPNDYSAFQKYLVDQGHSENTWFCPPQHLHYFQFHSMRKLLYGEGFEIVSLQAGFPIEQYLVNSHTNYTKKRELGKSLHLSRCEISNFLINQGIDEFINLRESFANLSFGRDIICVVKLK